MDLNGDVFKLLDGGHSCGMVVIISTSYRCMVATDRSGGGSGLKRKRKRMTSAAKRDDVNGMGS